MSLKKKIYLIFLMPLMLGILLLLGVSLGILAVYVPIWISNTNFAYFETVESDLHIYSYATKKELSNLFQNLIVELNIVSFFLNKSISGLVPQNLDYKELWVNRNYVDSIPAEIPKNFYNAWYHRNYSNFSEINDNNVIFNTLNLLTQVSVLVRPLMNVNQTSGIFKKLFYYVLDSNGLEFNYPPKHYNDSVGDLNQMDCDYSGKYKYDGRCREWYLQTVSNAGVTFVKPYKNYLSSEKIETTFCEKLTKNNKTYLVSCFDFNMSEWWLGFSDKFTNSKTFLIFPGTTKVINYGNSTLNYPFLDLDVEIFGLNTSYKEEQLKLQKEISFLNQISVYDNLKEEEVLLGQSIEFSKNNENFKLYFSSISLHERSSHYNDSNSFKFLIMANLISIDEINKSSEDILIELYLQAFISLGIILLIAFFSILITIYYAKSFALSISIPIDELIKTLKVIDTHDIAKAISYIEGEEKKNFNEMSYEMNVLSDAILKIFNALRLGTDAFFSGNDAVALIKYCEALNLYRDMGNCHGVGICQNNIGNIHLKNFRFLEAIESYQQAVSIIDEERKKYASIESSNKRVLEKEIFLDESYRKYTRIWANRVFQLAEAKLEKIFHETKIERRNHHIAELDDVINLYDSSKNTFNNLGGLSFHKTITISIKTSFAYLIQEKLEKAEEMCIEAENSYKTLEQRGFENLDIPDSVLKQKLLVQKGLISKKKRKYREAVEFFTLSLETCELYDPKTKRECLKELKEIFEIFSLETTNLDQMIDKFRPLIKDIVFLVDISESMTGIKIIKAIESILKVYTEYIKDYDRVGYILFNEKVHSIFSLENKIHNDAYFRSVLAKIPMTSGSTKLFDSLDAAINEFTKNPFIINQPLSIEMSKKIVHKKIILLITDGLDNNSRTTSEFVKTRLNNVNVNLITIGYTFKNEIIDSLRDLVYATQEGIYVDIDASENLDYVFLNMEENKARPILQVESFT